MNLNEINKDQYLECSKCLKIKKLQYCWSFSNKYKYRNCYTLK